MTFARLLDAVRRSDDRAALYDFHRREMREAGVTDARLRDFLAGR